MTEEMQRRHRAWLVWYEEQLALEQAQPEACIEMLPCECPDASRGERA